jgi:ribosomal protein S6E (S10)
MNRNTLLISAAQDFEGVPVSLEVEGFFMVIWTGEDAGGTAIVVVVVLARVSVLLVSCFSQYRK